MSGNIIKAERILTIHKNTLTENRIAFIGLTRLDPESAVFPSDASTLLSTLETTQQEGLDQINAEPEIPDTNILSNNKYSEMLIETAGIYENQKNITDNIKSSKSYSEGLNILRSEASISLLTKQTNIIFEYQYWLDKMK